MQKRRTEKGFSAFEAIIVVLVVAILGVGGWYVWHTSQKNNKPDQSAHNTDGTNKTSKPADPSEGGKYLVIKEWGVRFLLPEDLRGQVSYGIETSSTNDTQTAWFEVRKVADIPGSNCKLIPTTNADNSGKSGGIGSFILRTSNKVSTEQESLLTYANMSIGNYWYSGGYGKYADSCAGSEGSNQQLAGDTGRLLSNAFGKLEQSSTN